MLWWINRFYRNYSKIFKYEFAIDSVSQTIALDCVDYTEYQSTEISLHMFLVR